MRSNKDLTYKLAKAIDISICVAPLFFISAYGYNNDLSKLSLSPSKQISEKIVQPQVESLVDSEPIEWNKPERTEMQDPSTDLSLNSLPSIRY